MFVYFAKLDLVFHNFIQINPINTMSRKSHNIKAVMESSKNLYQTEPCDDEKMSGVLNAKQMQKEMQAFQQIIKQAKKEDNVAILWGFTGAGKSTSATILGGERVKSYHLDAQEAIIVAANPKFGERDIKINSSYESGTIYPSPITIKNSKLDGQKIILWDMPGLGENRSKLQIIVNSYFIHHVFKFYEKVKLIFALDFNIISRRNKSQKNQHSIKQLTDVLGMFKRYQKSVAVMFTKVQPGVQETHIKANISKMLLEVKYLDDYSQFKTFLKQIVNGNVPITVLNIPKIPQQPRLSESEAVDVTGQYSNFVRDTYTILQSLQPHPFTQINNILSKEQKDSCKPFLFQTSNKIESQIRQIIKQITQKINDNYNKINLKESNQEKLRKNMESFKTIGEDIAQLMKFTSLEDSMLNRQDMLKEKMNKLQIILIKIGCSNQKGEIQSLTQITNQFIVVSFFSTLKLYDNQKETKIIKSENEVKVRLFQQIQKKNLSKIYDQRQAQVHKNIKIQMKDIFLEYFLKTLPDSEVYTNWLNEYKIIPAIFKSLTLHNQYTDPEKYFQYSIDLTKTFKLTDPKNLQQIISLLKYNNSYVKHKLNFQFVKQQVIPVIEDRWNSLIENVKKQDYFNNAMITDTIRSYEQIRSRRLQQIQQIEGEREKNIQQKKIIKRNADEIQQKKYKIKALQNQLTLYKNNKDKDKTQISNQLINLKNQNNTLLVEKKTMEKKCSTLQDNLETFRIQIISLRNQLQNKKKNKDSSELGEYNQILVNQSPQQLFDKGKITTTETSKLKSSLKEANQKLVQMQRSLQEDESQINKLKKENEKLKANAENSVAQQKQKRCMLCFWCC